MLSGKCDVRVELHQQGGTYCHGDKVTGEVVVDVNKTCTCDGLLLTHEWQTHGRGNKDWDSLAEEVLYKGTWQPGSYRYPFSITISQSTPATYHGKIVNVDNYIKVRADIPWALDPKDEADFLVVPQGVVGFEIDTEQTIEHKMLYGWILCAVLWVPFLIFGAVFSEVSWEDFTSIEHFVRNNWILASASVVFLMLQVIGLYRYKQLTLMGAVTVRMKKSLREPRMVNIDLEFKPKVDMMIDDISVSLIRHESATSGSGTNESTHTDSVTVESVQFDTQNKHQTAHTSFLGRGKLCIPKNLLPAFSAVDNRVAWKVELNIKTSRSKDFSLTEILEVDDGGNLQENLAAHDAA